MATRPSNGGSPLSIDSFRRVNPIDRRKFLVFAGLGTLQLALAACGGATDPVPPTNPINEQFADDMGNLVGVRSSMSLEQMDDTLFNLTYVNALTPRLGIRKDLGVFVADKNPNRIRVQLDELGEPFFPDHLKPLELKIFAAPENASIATFPRGVDIADLGDLDNLSPEKKAIGIFYGNPGVIGRIKARPEVVEHHLSEMASRSRARFEVFHYNLMPSNRFQRFLDVGNLQIPVNPPQLQLAATKAEWISGKVVRQDTIFNADVILAEAEKNGASFKAELVNSAANELINRRVGQDQRVWEGNLQSVRGDEGPSTLLGLAAMNSAAWGENLLGTGFLQFAELVAAEVAILEKNR